jgi:hypothetical protein
MFVIAGPPPPRRFKLTHYPKDIKGSFEWVSTDGQTIRLTVSWAD